MKMDKITGTALIFLMVMSLVPLTASADRLVLEIEYFSVDINAAKGGKPGGGGSSCEAGTGYKTFAHWDHFPISYSINLGGGISGSAVSKGFDAWEAIYSGSLFTSGGQGAADITVGTDNIDGPGGTLAVTYTWYFRGSGVIDRVEMYFDSGDNWINLSFSCDGYDGSGFDTQSVATHEVGHALGLDHSSKSDALTMYPYYAGSRAQTLAQGDIDGFNSLYGSSDGGGNCHPKKGR